MAEKQFYPAISEKSWWQLRSQFKKTIPSVVNVSYLKSLLSLNSDQSARNILAPLKQMGIIDTDGKPQPRATDWRSDVKYPDVCSAIISEIYPQELLDLFPDAQVDNATAKSWFMDTCSLGDNAAGKITSTFSMLKSGQIKSDADVTKASASPKKAKSNKPQKSIPADNANKPVSASPMPAVDVNTPTIPASAASPTPSVHIDLQIHISPDASPEQIDSIFASMAKHLYGRS
ncbi:MAG: DUF5343 domain-containing protein [Clostridia bacterium]|nr:DUF5343 domain-containing protein [Clostridia bacterium]